MSGGIGRRIKSLEALHDQESCAECGDAGGNPETWEVVWMDPEEPAESKWCGTCGRPLEVVITWGDDNEPERKRS